MDAFSGKAENIIIIGAGAAGLMAACELLSWGHNVTILEANERLGGRIHTVHPSSFTQPIERGVEFIHGKLPLTTQLLKEAGIKYKPVRGRMFRLENGELKLQQDFTPGWSELITRMNELREDTTVDEFLAKYFQEEKYAALKTSVTRFAEGFDLADTSRASILALREEWMKEEEEEYRIPGGYNQLIYFLENKCSEHGAIINASSYVEEIMWKKDEVRVFTREGKTFFGHKVIVTISLGLLQAEPSSVIFQPQIDRYLDAAKKIGFGSVIKVLLEFNEAFWEREKKNIGFVFSDEQVPTWWTQSPSDVPLLTGWAGGSQSGTLEFQDDQTILHTSLQSLSNIFGQPIDKLKQLLTASLVANWRNDPFSKGAYSYSTVESQAARKIFNTPIEGTIFFAGEAFYQGPSPGTVEAALVSGRSVAEKILECRTDR